MKDELVKQLTALALQKSRPFCYSCYKDAPTGRCRFCHSDDLMRHLPGVGVEYGTDWIILDFLSGLEAANTEELFEESLRGCYPDETKIGWLTVDTVSAIKELDPVSWDLARQEWIGSEENEERLISFDNGGTYFTNQIIEEFLAG